MSIPQDNLKFALETVSRHCIENFNGNHFNIENTATAVIPISTITSKVSQFWQEFILGAANAINDGYHDINIRLEEDHSFNEIPSLTSISLSNLRSIFSYNCKSLKEFEEYTIDNPDYADNFLSHLLRDEGPEDPRKAYIDPLNIFSLITIQLIYDNALTNKPISKNWSINIRKYSRTSEHIKNIYDLNKEHRTPAHTVTEVRLLPKSDTSSQSAIQALSIDIQHAINLYFEYIAINKPLEHCINDNPELLFSFFFIGTIFRCENLNRVVNTALKNIKTLNYVDIIDFFINKQTLFLKNVDIYQTVENICRLESRSDNHRKKHNKNYSEILDAIVEKLKENVFFELSIQITYQEVFTNKTISNSWPIEPTIYSKISGYFKNICHLNKDLRTPSHNTTEIRLLPKLDSGNEFVMQAISINIQKAFHLYHECISANQPIQQCISQNPKLIFSFFFIGTILRCNQLNTALEEIINKSMVLNNTDIIDSFKKEQKLFIENVDIYNTIHNICQIEIDSENSKNLQSYDHSQILDAISNRLKNDIESHIYSVQHEFKIIDSNLLLSEVNDLSPVFYIENLKASTRLKIINHPFDLIPLVINNPNLGNLALSDCYLKNPEQFYTEDNPFVLDLQGFTNLNSLIIQNMNLTHLHLLLEDTNTIKNLYIATCKIKNFNFLSDTTQIENITILYRAKENIQELTDHLSINEEIYNKCTLRLIK